ncbi:MAG: hypothetical protein AB7S68_13240 [Polyangiaceae bacterium]
MSVSPLAASGAVRPREEPEERALARTQIRTDSREVSPAAMHLVTASSRRSASGPRPRAAGAATQASHPSPATVEKRLDAFRRAFAGPYAVDGERAFIDPHFRMNGGYGTNPGDALKRARAALPPKVLAKLQGALLLTATGKATPQVLVRVTQALIDAGAHHEFGRGEGAVRKMMWAYGIGVDCSGYCRQAFMATRGVSDRGAATRYGLGRNIDGFDPDQLQRFRKVSPLMVRAGDVGKLGLGRENHKVIVVSHDIVPAGRGTSEVPGHGTLPESFHRGGRVHLFQVDSSWGAGPNGNAHGGVGRRVWVYSEASGLWGSYHVVSGKLETSKLGPYGYELNGFFRPRMED